jgi:Cu(I)/Ag(I) efflux system membrane fusion protein
VAVDRRADGHVIKKYQVEGEYVEEGARLYDIADLSTVWIEAQIYEDELAFLRLKQPVSATTNAFPTQKFPGEVAFIHPHLDRTSRTIRVRFDVDNPQHDLRPGMYATVTLGVPAGQLELLLKAATAEWVKGTSLDTLGRGLFSPAGPIAPAGLGPALNMARERALLQRGLVLAVPERAIIDTGSRKVVYREYLPNVFEGVLVEVGPRMVGPDKTAVLYPVVHGLEPGDKVVTTGSFLIDAETRLTSGASSTYFGASAGPQGTEHRAAITAGAFLMEDEDAKIKAALGKLSTPDRRLALAQEFCPIKPANRLGTMGVPFKVILKGKPVFLC